MPEFNFENHIPKKEEELSIEDQLTEEEKQLRFEEECITEAKKLEVSLEDLKYQIDYIGGIDKFKEKYERAVSYHGTEGTDNYKIVTNEAGLLIGKEEFKAKQLDKSAKGSLKIAALMGAIAIGVNALSHPEYNDFGLDGNAIKEIVIDLSNKTSDAKDYFHVFFTAMPAILAMIVAKVGISEKIEARKLKRQQKIDELRFKMSGVDVKRENL